MTTVVVKTASYRKLESQNRELLDERFRMDAEAVDQALNVNVLMTEVGRLTVRLQLALMVIAILAPAVVVLVSQNPVVMGWFR